MTKRDPWEPTQSDPVPQVANGTAAQWHPTRGPTPDVHRFEQVRAKVYEAAIQIRPDLKCQIDQARQWRRMSGSVEEAMDRFDIPMSPTTPTIFEGQENQPPKGHRKRPAPRSFSAPNLEALMRDDTQPL